MNIRRSYPFLALANLMAGGFLVVATFAFAQATVATLGWAVSIGVGVFGLAMAALGTKALQRSERIGISAIGLVTAILAGWTIVAANVFVPGIAQWLVFASGCAHIGLSATSMILHEVTTERVVHHLEVQAEREPAERVS